MSQQIKKIFVAVNALFKSPKILHTKQSAYYYRKKYKDTVIYDFDNVDDAVEFTNKLDSEKKAKHLNSQIKTILTESIAEPLIQDKSPTRNLDIYGEDSKISDPQYNLLKEYLNDTPNDTSVDKTTSTPVSQLASAPTSQSIPIPTSESSSIEPSKIQESLPSEKKEEKAEESEPKKGFDYYYFFNENQSKFDEVKKLISKDNTYTLYFDGASKGNPGRAGAGYALCYNDLVLYTNSLFVGLKTNNVAEYLALIYGMRSAQSIGVQKLLVRGDSQLIINQMENKFKVKSMLLIGYYEEAKKLSKEFNEINFEHIPRNSNKFADYLASKIINIKKKT